MATHYCARCLTTWEAAEPAATCPNLGCGSKRPDAGWGEVFAAGALLDRHYRITRPLAVGGAGITYLAREVDANNNPQPPDLAIKVLYTQRASGPFLRRLSNEAQILQDLAHEHIVQCRGFVHRTGHEPYLVTRFEQGGCLTEHIEQVGALPAGVAVGVLRQIVRALEVAHQRGVVHRDLKPDNVLLQARTPVDVLPHIRLTDFGIAKVAGAGGAKLTRLGGFVGTPEYAAPEQFEGLHPTPATDLFAAGGVLFYCLTGRPPVDFTHRNDLAQTYDELLAQLPPALPAGLFPPDVHARLNEAIAGAMQAKPEDRWSAPQLLAHLAPLEGRDAADDDATLGVPRGAADALAAPPTAPARGSGTPPPAPPVAFTAPVRAVAEPTLHPSAPPPAEPAAPPPPAPRATPEPAARAATPAPTARLTPEPVARAATPSPVARASSPPTGSVTVRRAGVVGVSLASAAVAFALAGAVTLTALAALAWALGWFGGAAGPAAAVQLAPMTF
jgi:serine/threonine protein kinase